MGSSYEIRAFFFLLFVFKEEGEISIAPTRRKFILASNHTADRYSEFKYPDRNEIKRKRGSKRCTKIGLHRGGEKKKRKIISPE